jgi:hypothetical protein
MTLAIAVIRHSIPNKNPNIGKAFGKIRHINIKKIVSLPSMSPEA